MTLKELKNKKVELEKSIEKLINQFQEETQSIVSKITLSIELNQYIEKLEKIETQVEIETTLM